MIESSVSSRVDECVAGNCREGSMAIWQDVECEYNVGCER